MENGDEVKGIEVNDLNQFTTSTSGVSLYISSDITGVSQVTAVVVVVVTPQVYYFCGDYLNVQRSVSKKAAVTTALHKKRPS